jgi:N-acyl-D-amino-acid deacylase
MSAVRSLALTLTLALISSSCAGAGPAGGAPGPAGEPYDVVITGGRVVDGTGNPWFYGDVAIRGDRIARIAPAGALASARAARRIDATNMVVAPGFIDIQSHSWDPLLWADGRVVSKVTQGVTSEILGEATTPAPSNANLEALVIGPSDSAQAKLQPLFRGDHGFGSWLDAMERHGNSVNFGSYLGAATVRAYTMGQRAGAPTAAELDTMRAVVRHSMADGAFGISSALIYPPGSFATTNELVEEAKAMAPFHGGYITHMRSEDDQLFEAMDEAFRIGREGGVRVDIYHLKASLHRNWGKAAHMVAKIDSARQAGLDVGATMYPYPASGNGLDACIPDWASADGKLMANLQDPVVRARIVRDMTDPAGTPLCQVEGPAAYMVVGFRDSTLKKYEGKRLAEIAEAMGKPWAEAVVDLALAERGRLSKINFTMSEDNVRMQIAQPWVVIGTDAGGFDPDSARGLVHPRAYGSYPRILGTYVRDTHVLRLEDAVRKMTSAVADRLSLRDRGLLRAGMFADVVVFDPATIADRATYDQPHQLSVGVRDVFVNGVAVLSEGKHTGARPGRALRGPGWTGNR